MLSHGIPRRINTHLAFMRFVHSVSQVVDESVSSTMSEALFNFGLAG